MSSAGRRWRGRSAELRFHPIGAIPPYVASFTQVSILVRGTNSRSPAIRGDSLSGQLVLRVYIGLFPLRVSEDFTYVAKYVGNMLHIFLSPGLFVALAKHTVQGFYGQHRA